MRCPIRATLPRWPGSFGLRPRNSTHLREEREHPDVAIAELAQRQHGIVSRTELLTAGLSSDEIWHRTNVGRLHRLHAGVYAVGHLLLPRFGAYLAAVLACGEGAVLSHRAGAALLGLGGPPSGPIDVTVPRRGGQQRSGIAVHRTRCLPGSEITEAERVPCTTPARTLVDLAAVAGPRELRRALERSLELNLFDRTALDATLGRSRGRRGVVKLRRLLSRLPDEPPPVRSELERRFLHLIRAARLPTPVVNARVAGLEVDFHWPDQRVVVETDGRATHGAPHAFERDRSRDLQLGLAGWHVVRLSWRQVVHTPERVTTLLRYRLVTRSPENR